MIIYFIRCFQDQHSSSPQILYWSPRLFGTLRRKCFASADAAFVAICLIGVLIEPSDFVGTVGTVEWIAQRLVFLLQDMWVIFFCEKCLFSSPMELKSGCRLLKCCSVYPDESSVVLAWNDFRNRSPYFVEKTQILFFFRTIFNWTLKNGGFLKWWVSPTTHGFSY